MDHGLCYKEDERSEEESGTDESERLVTRPDPSSFDDHLPRRHSTTMVGCSGYEISHPCPLTILDPLDGYILV